MYFFFQKLLLLATMADYHDYCEAIQKAKLPAKPSGSGSRDRCFDDTESFQDFVKHVHSDMDPRDMHIADFTQGGEVASALHDIRSRLQSGLQQRLDYDGILFQIGSFYDGSKTGRLNEMDCLYVVSKAGTKVQQHEQVSEIDIRVEQVCSGKADVRVYVKDTEIKPREVNKKLIAAMEVILSEMTLPDGWTHGGYAAPNFSGTRCNGPSVTAMFCNGDEKHISLDVSIAFPLTSQLQQRADFPSRLKHSCQFLADKIKKIQKQLSHTQISGDLHLIGNLADDTWQPTTALAESEILRSLRPECSVKRALEICKVIASIIQRWYEKHSTLTMLTGRPSKVPVKRIRLSPSSAEHARQSILAALQNYSECSPCSKAENRKRLNEAMAYRHIYLSSADRNKFGEVLKSDASINNAAIKHIILKTALQLNAFSETNRQLEQQLLRAVFEELSSTDSFYTDHALIPGCTINKFSFSMFLSHSKESIAIDFAHQCEAVLDNVFAQVNINRLFHHVNF